MRPSMDTLSNRTLAMTLRSTLRLLFPLCSLFSFPLFFLDFSLLLRRYTTTLKISASPILLYSFTDSLLYTTPHVLTYSYIHISYTHFIPSYLRTFIYST
ncbi:hypothetical protein L228DRAFT_35126 [Xylona heveae TC161]|uniref:Uncharacterized protein n=1 Tax=Xylona heveae (strain CBS 132557 / TC161) TaxID=1328760 RepID=A0A165A7P0_XYLHT|nr:hypothetical protein L228DRAFT_35126 [Xylona heveae TC161]KZF20071.1 hypothetical protein L228DRAFT_35126 [Xylona heveae TC161]